MIPKRIFFTYISDLHLSSLQLECYNRAKALHPDWEVSLYSDEDCLGLVKTATPELEEMYLAYPHPIQRSDLFRILAVKQLGGFYLDLDLLLHEPLDPLVEASAVFPLEWRMSRSHFLHRHKREVTAPRELWQVGQYAFGADKEHRFLSDIVEEMIVRTEILEPGRISNNDILFSTGPDCVTDVYHKNRHSYTDLGAPVRLLRGRIVAASGGVKGTEGGRHWHQFGRYGQHLLTGTWRLPAG